MDEESHGRGKYTVFVHSAETPGSTSCEGEIKRIKKLIEADNAYAFNNLASCNGNGNIGMPQDWSKANELYLRAGELGCAEAYYNLGNSYYDGRGVEADKKKAKHYWELAAMNGDVNAMYNLGCQEANAGTITKQRNTTLLRCGEERI